VIPSDVPVCSKIKSTTSTLMTEPQKVSVTLVLITTPMRVIAQEYFGAFTCHETSNFLSQKWF
jgi:hypothetical protein